MYRIRKRQDLSDIIKLLVVDAPLIAEKAEPGQFIILRVRDQGERIPLTIADFDREKGQITLVFQIVGLTTELLAQLEEGDSLLDLVGPLGQPAHLPESGRVACIAGGVGVAPLYPKAKALYQAGVEVITIIGARDKGLLVMTDMMDAVSTQMHLCTDDGSLGYHGFVSGRLQELLDAGEQFDEVVAIGPLPMMRATVEVTRPLGLKTWVSLNPIMVDGTGMCGACRVSVGDKTQFACVDGPMFDGHLVDFAEAMRRNQMYLPEEEKSLHHCRCRGGISHA